MIDKAGLLLVETRQVVVPLFQTELGVTRDSVDQSIVNVILAGSGGRDIPVRRQSGPGQWVACGNLVGRSRRRAK